MRTKLFLESTQNQRCFNVEIYRRINVDKSTLNQRGYHVDQRRDVFSTYTKVESTLSVFYVFYSVREYILHYEKSYKLRLKTCQVLFFRCTNEKEIIYIPKPS